MFFQPLLVFRFSNEAAQTPPLLCVLHQQACAHDIGLASFAVDYIQVIRTDGVKSPSLQFLQHEEGRVVMTGTIPEYQYHLKDHLGNTRVTFTTKMDVESAVATMEDANASSESSNFLYYTEAVKVNTTLFDHTNAGTTYPAHD